MTIIITGFLLSDERDGLSTSLEQSQKMVQTCSTELNKLKGQLAAAYQQINALQGGKEEVNGFYTFIFHSLNVRPIVDITYLRGVITMMYHNKASFSMYMISFTIHFLNLHYNHYVRHCGTFYRLK